MSNENFVSGVLRDPDDPRDYMAEAMYFAMGAHVDDPTSYPEKLDLSRDMPPVRDQGNRGTCAAQTAAAIKEWQEQQDSGWEGYMSPEFVYFHRSNKPAAGMFSRDVMAILQEHGCCTEDELPYVDDDDDAPRKISKKITRSAARNTIKSYARVTSMAGLKTALYQNGPCYISFPVFDERPEFWRQSNPNAVRQGGHAVTVVGYNERGFILRNSWGNSFGKNGHVIYPYSEFGVHWDIWTSIDESGTPKPPPSPVPPQSTCCQVL